MLYAFFKSIKAKIKLKNIHANTCKRIGDDLRKAGTLAGAGLIGIVVPNDAIDRIEGLIIIAFGLILWTFGQLFAYIADKVEQK
ncbi:hypothetical protein [Pasteurella oralis]|uniref:hypothetical protein n=1 Tax=Pasteurella oralis TaxID=1071947 RepID=UPI000C7E01C8|nr:hypothetical protein [Pasteurella oralis]